MDLILAIDVGNTNAVVGIMALGSPGRRPLLRHTWRISTHPVPTADELRAKIWWLLQEAHINIKDLEAVVISSVVPHFTEMLRQALAAPQYCSRLEFIDSRSPFSFQIAAHPPSQVGADRLVNAEAALRDYGSPCIIIDSGTATTLCAVDEASRYLGGAIMPGLELSVDALARRAAQLFSVELVAPERVIGGNTVEALRSGIMHGYASMIDGMVEKFRQELALPRQDRPGSIIVIGTGGISARLKPLTKNIDIFDADLTLKGIAYVYEALRR